MTAADCYRVFFDTPRMTWEELFAMLDQHVPLTCKRNGDGTFARDGNGAIVVVAVSATTSGKRSRQARQQRKRVSQAA